MTTLSVPIDASLIGELFLRSGSPDTNITDWIENVLRDYLDRTGEDEWSPAFHAWKEANADSENFTSEFGDPKGGYQWVPLWLPNGTLIKMEYKRQTYQAAVKFDRIQYEGERFSASEFAKAVASGTSRNAWRDLMIKRPGDAGWSLADDLRRTKRV
jgi:hypothetical protein